MYICPECGKADINENMLYCPECGCPIEYIKNNQPAAESNTMYLCPECFEQVSAEAEYCQNCGCPMSHILTSQISVSEYSAASELGDLISGAESGDLEAMYWLGYHYFYDDDDENEDLAEKWWKEAAQKGHEKAKADYEKNFEITINETADTDVNINTATNIVASLGMYRLKKLFERYDAIIAVDTETSGLDFQNNRIIELAAAKLVVINNEVVVERQMDHLIKLPCGTNLDYKITQLTGITEQQLQHEGKESHIVFNDFVNMFGNGKVLLVAYNAHFDLSFLYYSLVRENLDFVLRNADMLDALTVYKDRRSYPHKLENAIDAYNLTGAVSNTHRAIDDVLALVGVLISMDVECDDLYKYINLFGYNPKYGVQGQKIKSVTYLPQYYNSYKKLYE